MCMLSWNSRTSLKVPSDSISEGLIFQNFLGGACPQTPLDLACFACQIVCSSHNYHVHYNIFVPPPFMNPGSAPVSICLCEIPITSLPVYSNYISEGSVSHINGVWPVFLFEQLFAACIPSG